MVARVPGLADRWLSEVTAEQNWKSFRAADFQRLHATFESTGGVERGGGKVELSLRERRRDGLPDRVRPIRRN